MENIFDFLWCEKYRPVKMSQVVLSNRCRKEIDTILNKPEIPHILLCGNPGIGKTSIAKIIAIEKSSGQYRYKNASDENGIDSVRHDIKTFAETKSLFGNKKSCILDEADFLTKEAQAALRNIIEEYSNTTRFIFTANDRSRIVPAIQSRCVSIDIEFDKLDVFKHCEYILQQEGIQLTKNDRINLSYIVKNNFPDIRKTINVLQKICSSGKFEYEEITTNNTLCLEIFNILIDSKKNVLDLRKFLIENEQQFGNYNQLLTDFLNYIYEINSVDKDKKIDIILTIRDFLYQSYFITDLEINTFSCFMKIYKILHTGK